MDENDLLKLRVRKFIELKEYNIDKIKFDEPSDLETSTMTATCNVSIQFHLKNIARFLFENVYKNIINKEDLDYRINGIIYDDIYIKTCLNQKEKRKKKINESEFLIPKKKKRSFFNQATIYVKTTLGKVINIKLFTNGNTQMTGLKTEKDGLDALQFLINYLKNYDKLLVGDLSNIVYNRYKIVNINNTFNLYFKIDRKKFYEILIDKTNLYISHDRQRCAGILIYYNYNCNNTKKDGICRCMKELNCKGKGLNGTCKLCTINIFESGKGLVTGVNSMVQAYEAYNFIKNIINENNKNIIKICIDDIKIENSDLKEIGKKKTTRKKKLLVEEV